MTTEKPVECETRRPVASESSAKQGACIKSRVPTGVGTRLECEIGDLRLHELQCVLIGLAPYLLVEDRLGVVVAGAVQEAAFARQLESGSLDLADHLRLLDAV